MEQIIRTLGASIFILHLFATSTLSGEAVDLSSERSRVFLEHEEYALLAIKVNPGGAPPGKVDAVVQFATSLMAMDSYAGIDMINDYFLHSDGSRADGELYNRIEAELSGVDRLTPGMIEGLKRIQDNLYRGCHFFGKYSIGRFDAKYAEAILTGLGRLMNPSDKMKRSGEIERSTPLCVEAFNHQMSREAVRKDFISKILPALTDSQKQVAKLLIPSLRETPSIGPKERLGEKMIPFTSDAFLYRVRTGDLEAVKLFLQAGIDPNAKSNEGQTALLAALEGGSFHVVKALIEAGADVNVRWGQFETPILAKAVSTGSLDLVRFFLDHGAKVNPEPRGFRITPLMSAAELGSTEMVRLLLERGAEIDAKDKNEETAFHRTVKRGNFETMDLLLKHGANIDTQDYGRETPLIRAAREGKIALIKFLLARGANIQKGGSENAVYWAARARKMEAYRLLLENGGSGKALNNALLASVGTSDIETAKILLEAGADVNIRSERGSTPLMIAGGYGLENFVKFFIDHGADVNVKNYTGARALGLSSHNPKVAELIRSAGGVERYPDFNVDRPLFQGGFTSWVEGISDSNDLVFDDKGTLYVLSYDRSNGAIYKVNGNAPAKKRLPVLFVDHLTEPVAMAMSDGGDLYVVLQQGEILKIAPDAVVSSFVKGLKEPRDILFAGGALYVSVGAVAAADGVSGGKTDHGGVLKVGIDGKSSPFVSGLHDPWGLAVDRSGNLYVAERAAGEIMMVDSSGKVSSFVKGLRRPEELVFDSCDDLFISSEGFIDRPNWGPEGGGRIVIADPKGRMKLLSAGLDKPKGMVRNPAAETFLDRQSLDYKDLYVSDRRRGAVMERNIFLDTGPKREVLITFQKDMTGHDGAWINWAQVEGAAHYSIYRSNSPNGPWKKIWQTDRPQTTDGTVPSEQFYYYIEAIGPDGALLKKFEIFYIAGPPCEPGER